MKLLNRIFCRGIEHWAYIQIYDNYRILDLPWDDPLTWYLAAIFVDFCYYWGHRFSHSKSNRQLNACPYNANQLEYLTSYQFPVGAPSGSPQRRKLHVGQRIPVTFHPGLVIFGIHI